MVENNILRHIENIIKKLEGCNRFISQGREPSEYEEQATEDYNV